MKRFVLIDHSICDLAGHHYEYAVHVLRAAQSAGYEPVLVTNRRFREQSSVPWRVMPSYEFGFWPEPAVPWFVAAAVKFAPRFRRWWCELRARTRYSQLGLAWSCRFHWARYFYRRPADVSRLPGWGAGVALIFCAKTLRTVALLVLLPFVLLAAILWGLARVARPAASLAARATRFALTKALLPAPFQRYFCALLRELQGWVGFLLLRGTRNPSRQPGESKRQFLAFSRDTTRLLADLRPGPDDLFFFPTIAPRDLAALIQPLESNADALRASWHFLFRRNIYIGDRGEYQSQDPTLDPLRAVFQKFKRSAAASRSFFYTDTDELTEQYNRLGSFQFHTLPIPHTHSVVDRELSGPLRLTYLGDARTEKGFHLLHGIASEMQDYLFSGKARFVVQCNYNIPAGEPHPAVARSELETLVPLYAELYKEPLTSEQYRDLLVSADINLLPYDRVNYYARSSGILVESLAAGIPVIVPAGCWLSRQFLERYNAHLESLREEMKLLAAHTRSSIAWRHGGISGASRSTGDLLQATADQNGCTWFYVPDGSTHVLVSMQYAGGALQGQLQLCEFNWHDEPVTEPRWFCLEPAGERLRAVVLIPLRADLCKVVLSVGCRRKGDPISFRDVRVDFLRPRAGESVPTGAVGAIYHDESEIPALLRDMIDHYPHYRRTAGEFAAAWSSYHNADRLIREMTAVAGLTAPAARPDSATTVGSLA